ncbi:hypothetical protein JANAI62_36500 [Jannaschia pagri]|uniref:High-affinity zinc uptake system protein ZnuA n=1 Tax=Jannaschia pagri TaxID=2829797 RepID=A0ABQ4NRI7_9RHOB|nr:MULTISPECIES: metal ABC transporter substrate-binding protein [unclassified Jannaschia]GIT93206.1 hypothetical protein JANAI61_36640 [Jannaschia sp. AI_61]GIT97027.1 hypothetical protein JANAI62_36500 [Jannaschia sp. AI_62]
MRAAVAAVLLMAAPAWAQDRPVIVADSYPMAYFAERLTGGAAEVRLAVPEGRDPSSWRPGLSDIIEIQAADLIVLNGAGLSDWTTRAALPRARTVETARGLEAAFIATETITHSHGEEGSHSHEGVATHTWLDLDLAAQQAEVLATALGRALPEATPDDALTTLLSDLQALDVQGDALVADMPVPVIASHPRYEYLGQAYGLSVTSLDWEAGATPDAAQLIELRGRMAETGAGVFLWEAAPPDAAREAVAALGLAQAVFPPLAMPPEQGDFLDAFRQGLSDLETALTTSE